MEVYGACNIKGGSGKSSLILNLARRRYELEQQRGTPRHITFIDLDEFQSSSIALTAMGLGGEGESAAIHCPIIPRRPVLDTMLVEIEDANPDAIVFVDTPANSTELLSQLAVNANKVFVPVLPDPMSRTMLIPTLDVIRRAQKVNPALEVHAVLIGVSHNRRRLVQQAVDAVNETGVPLAATHIPDRVSITGNFGQHVSHPEYNALYTELFGGNA
ncbi:ParA family protein [Deinococcus sp. 6YEL10]|uniref:ParA family protein n=1 Tax=Deinococcus sp. 6YEL10 TaxID=2745870 RepID=UPI001E64F917|nr:ParA family protein [Deinococcus sp. 6YEL10]MCD0159802.1 ParA family protein [Deinococcus sp. 6YEL10]